jgi:hypothetical protein
VALHFTQEDIVNEEEPTGSVGKRGDDKYEP